jgi:capsular polysaccharide biosynthesis protein
MEFWSTIVGLLRRKQVLVPAALVALVLGALVFVATPTTYISSTTMVLTTTEYGGSESKDPASPTQLTNPLLNFNDSLTTTSAILIQAMNTPDVAARLGARGPTRIVVDDGRSNPDLLGLNGPFLYIQVRSTSSAKAHRTVVEAQKVMREKLLSWQTSLGAPAKTYVALADVVPPTAAEPNRSRAVKLGLIAFFFGLCLSVGIAYLRFRHRARRQQRASTHDLVVDRSPDDRHVHESEPSPAATTPTVDDRAAAEVADPDAQDADLTTVSAMSGAASTNSVSGRGGLLLPVPIKKGRSRRT